MFRWSDKEDQQKEQRYDAVGLREMHDAENGAGPVSLAWIRSLAPYRITNGTWSRWVAMASRDEVPQSGHKYQRKLKAPRSKRINKVSLMTMIKLLVIIQHHSPIAKFTVEPFRYKFEEGLQKVLPPMRRVKPMTIDEMRRSVLRWLRTNEHKLAKFHENLLTKRIDSTLDFVGAVSAVVSGRLGCNWKPKWRSVLRDQCSRAGVAWGDRRNGREYDHAEVMKVANEILRTYGKGRSRDNDVIGDL